MQKTPGYRTSLYPVLQIPFHFFIPEYLFYPLLRNLPAAVCIKNLSASRIFFKSISVMFFLILLSVISCDFLSVIFFLCIHFN